MNHGCISHSLPSRGCLNLRGGISLVMFPIQDGTAGTPPSCSLGFNVFPVRSFGKGGHGSGSRQ